MASTPEGLVKKQIDKLLEKAHVRRWTWKPVVRVMGKPALDYICSIDGRFVAIEAKASGEWLTSRQRATARDIYLSGGKVFVISGPEGLAALERYLEHPPY
jgi:hypothetical protein